MSDNYTHTDEDGDRIEVYGSLESAIVWLTDRTGNIEVEVRVPKEEAPALALAVLEAAGCDDQPFNSISIGIALDQLRSHARVQAARKAGKLDEEAKALYEATQTVTRHPVAWGESWRENEREAWRAVARKARELHKEEGTK